MKNVIKFVVACMAITLFTTNAWSQSSPMLILSPTQVHLDAEIGDTICQTVNIKIAGLPTLSMVSSFDISIQGMDPDQFYVVDPPVSLMQLLQELLGGGHDFQICYAPTSPGPHDATVLIDAALLGVLMPVQSTLPVTGTTLLPQGPPQVISTTPANGTANVQANELFIDIMYNQNITVVDPSLITINGTPALNVMEDENILSIDNLSADNPVLLSGQSYTVVIGAGAIEGENGRVTIQDYTFTFSTNDYPVVVSTNPAEGSIIESTPTTTPGTYIDITFTFDRNITQGFLGEIRSLNEAFPIENIAFNGNNALTIGLSNNASIGRHQVQIEFEQGAVMDANSNQNLEQVFTYYVEANLARSIKDTDSDGIKNKVSESFYTLTGAQVSKYELKDGGFYIKRILFDDGSTTSEKFIERKW